MAIQPESVLSDIEVVDSGSLCGILHDTAEKRLAPPVPTDASHRAPRVRSISETCGRRYWRGFSRVRRGRASWCAWKTSTARGYVQELRKSSSPTFGPWGSTGTAPSCASRRGWSFMRRLLRVSTTGTFSTPATVRGRRSGPPPPHHTASLLQTVTLAPAVN